MKRTSKAQLLANYFHAFVDSRDGRKSSATTRGYIQAMTLYMRYLEKERKVSDSELTFSHFNSAIVTDWLDWLRNERHNDPATCNIRLGQIRTFFKWLKKQHPEYRNIYNDLKDIELLQTVNKIEAVEAISQAGIAALLAAPGTRTPTGLKYTALMSFLYGTGTRSDEALSIKMGELNLNCSKPSVTVTGKGRKMRTVNIPSKTVKILKKYILLFHGEAVDPNAYLFYSPSKGKYSKLSESGLNKQMDKYSRKAHEMNPACPEHVHPHQLRHSWATHALENNVPVIQISKILGHENVETTMTYLGITASMKLEAMEKTESFVAKSTKINWRKTKSLEDLFK